MITLRHHVITIVAIFLALAVGLVLGSEGLSEISDSPATATLDSPTSGESVDASGDFGQAFAGAVTPGLVAGKLDGQQVSVVTAPGADEQVVTSVEESITAAGGAVAGRYALTEAMFDPSQKSLVDTLGSQLMTQNPEDVSSDPSTYDRMGQLLGMSVATTGRGGNVNAKARAVLDAISGADLVSVTQPADKRAALVLFVFGSDAGDEGVDAIVSGLLGGFARTATGVVAAGSVADGGTGQLGRLRADPAGASVATVDGVETGAGQAAAVLTLAKTLTSPGGSFGASGSDGPVPLG